MLVSAILIPMANAQSLPIEITKLNTNTVITDKGNEIATVYAEHYDSQVKKVVKEPIMELNRQDGEVIKQQLINVDQSNLPNQDKIKEQMRI